MFGENKSCLVGWWLIVDNRVSKSILSIAEYKIPFHQEFLSYLLFDKRISVNVHPTVDCFPMESTVKQRLGWKLLHLILTLLAFTDIVGVLLKDKLTLNDVLLKFCLCLAFQYVWVFFCLPEIKRTHTSAIIR